MTDPTRRPARIAAAALLGGLAAASARAEMSAEELAKLAQNPVGNLISLPLQNNTNFNVGPRSGTQNIFNIEPVVPISVNAQWNVITRTILPLIWQPGYGAGEGTTFGLGDLQFSAFLSPAQPHGLIWGVGAVVQAPTDTQGLGNKNWGLGPTAVLVKMEKGNPWVYGALVNNIWSLSSDERGGAYNNFLLQPFVNYNLPGGTYVNSVPIITANWKAASGQQWTVPLGLGVGHVFHFGKLPVNMQLGGYYNVVHPDDGANWQLRFQMQFMFPK
ncbi:MAG: transporter [Burkholderiales bacterium]|nr:transporter [Burkholderiales bacterium]